MIKTVLSTLIIPGIRLTTARTHKINVIWASSLQEILCRESYNVHFDINASLLEVKRLTVKQLTLKVHSCASVMHLIASL